MKSDSHQQAAIDLDRSTADLGDPAVKPYIYRFVIEGYWGAAFQWIAYGSATKHGKHKENHKGLAKFLRDQGESVVAQAWEGLEATRAGGWYGANPTLAHVDKARQYWQEIRTWALS